MKLVAVLLLALAGLAQAQEGRFAFATREEAWAVLGAQDDYVRATAPLERTVVLRTPGKIDERAFAEAMASQVVEWPPQERAALGPVLARLEAFIAEMKWAGPRRILLVKVEQPLMNGFPHTRGNAIVLPRVMLSVAFQKPEVMDYLLPHEAFHVLSRANPALREQLYQAIGFRACETVELPADLAALRLTNPDAPHSRHAITARRAGSRVEVLPFVHLESPNVDARAGFATQIRTVWLPVERQGERCTARDERLGLDELQGIYEQVGRNTEYLIHPEEILADNFAYLFRPSPEVTSPEILRRMRRILQ